MMLGAEPKSVEVYCCEPPLEESGVTVTMTFFTVVYGVGGKSPSMIVGGKGTDVVRSLVCLKCI